MTEEEVGGIVKKMLRNMKDRKQWRATIAQGKWYIEKEGIIHDINS